ncbi:MAG: four helix bundle protein [Cyanobacteria bacterium SID2]|nr:four helix bundle protein [Cyanobacteria bacterium SID2]MBP0006754.1 four helix bundle protein [Cyanobacteria bacterium SBC]
MIAKSLVYEKAFQFAVRIVNAYKYLCKEKNEFVLSKQLLRSGTSIGANIAEANGAISKVEFKAKMSIAYKECLETKYWLSLLQATEYINDDTFNSVHNDAEELSKMLFSIIRSSRENLNSPKH